MAFESSRSLARPPDPAQPPDPDVALDLQAVLDRAYDAADYGKYIFGETPEPPLSEEQLAWVRSFISSAQAAQRPKSSIGRN